MEAGREQECNQSRRDGDRVQVWEAELRKIPGCKLVQMVGNFKMLPAVKCVGKEETIISIRKILH